jgi:hypothetical protein
VVCEGDVAVVEAFVDRVRRLAANDLVLRVTQPIVAGGERASRSCVPLSAS